MTTIPVRATSLQPGDIIEGFGCITKLSQPNGSPWITVTSVEGLIRQYHPTSFVRCHAPASVVSLLAQLSASLAGCASENEDLKHQLREK